MRRLFLAAVVFLAVAMSNRSMAADVYGAPKDGLLGAWVEGPTCNPWVDYDCASPKVPPAVLRSMERNGNCDPYLDYKCLDVYLGNDVATRFLRYYQLEWGKAVAPSDPSAPPSRRSEAAWPPTPQSTPPTPFTEWPYGGTQNHRRDEAEFGRQSVDGCDCQYRTGSRDERRPCSNYGWVNVGGNISTNNVKPGGNAPAAYDYTPNTMQLDQAVLYVERLADTTQNDHFDWGFRFSDSVWRELSLYDGIRTIQQSAPQ